MRCLQNRHSHKRGASMVIALVFLLLCTMVGTVVITSATAGIGAVISERQDARRTLALTSAAEYVSAELQKATYTASYVKTEKETLTYTQKSTSSTGETENGVEYDISKESDNPTYTNSSEMLGDGLFAATNGGGKFLFDFSALSNVDETTGNSAASNTKVIYNLIFSVSNGTDTGNSYNIKDVTGQLTMGTDYKATIVLTCGTDSLTLTFPASKSTNTTRNVNTTQKTNTVTKTTETTYKTTVTWGEPTIVKGGSTT